MRCQCNNLANGFGNSWENHMPLGCEQSTDNKCDKCGKYVCASCDTGRYDSKGKRTETYCLECNGPFTRDDGSGWYPRIRFEYAQLGR